MPLSVKILLLALWVSDLYSLCTTLYMIVLHTNPLSFNFVLTSFAVILSLPDLSACGRSKGKYDFYFKMSFCSTKIDQCEVCLGEDYFCVVFTDKYYFLLHRYFPTAYNEQAFVPRVFIVYRIR